MEDIFNIVSEVEQGIDVYFPVKDHQKKWLASDSRDNLLVAYHNPYDEWGPVTAYNLDGERFELDAKTVPDVPALIINACEHPNGHEMHGNINLPNREMDDGDHYGGGGEVDNTGRIYFEWIAFDDWTEYEPWGSGDPEFKIFFAMTDEDIYWMDYDFGDEYGYWDWFGYHKYIPNGGWNHKHQYFMTMPESNLDKFKYGSVKLIEVDTDTWDVEATLKVPLGLDKTGAVGEITIEYNWADDVVGENTFIKLGGYPYPRYRDLAPDKNECPPVGEASISFWWDK